MTLPSAVSPFIITVAVVFSKLLCIGRIDRETTASPSISAPIPPVLLLANHFRNTLQTLVLSFSRHIGGIHGQVPSQTSLR